MNSFYHGGEFHFERTHPKDNVAWKRVARKSIAPSETLLEAEHRMPAVGREAAQ